MRKFLFTTIISLLILLPLKSSSQSYYLDASESELLEQLLKFDTKSIFRDENSEGVFVNWSDSVLQWDATAFFKDGLVNRVSLTPFSDIARENFKSWLNGSGAIKMTTTDWKFYYDDKKMGVIQERYDSSIRKYIFIVFKI